MPPKELPPKKPTPQSARPDISEASLFFVPEDAIEGYQDRIETGIDWTLLEQAARHHRNACLSDDIPSNPFSQALQTKIQKSLFGYFLNEESGLTLEELWEFMLPITLWDNENFANDEGKICFFNTNGITDSIVDIIKMAVKNNNRDIVKREFKLVNILRVNDAEMTELDDSLMEYHKLVNLNLCGNFIENVDAKMIPPTVRILELQANRIKSVNFCEFLPAELLYLGLSRNLLTSDLEHFSKLPRNIQVLDLSDNDIYHLEPTIDALAKLPFLNSLFLAGNPCSVSAAYARLTLSSLPRIQWLDGREVLPTDRAVDGFEPHPDDLLSNYFTFTIFRIMSAPMPPKPEKGAVATFHVELEIPLLDSTRRNFLMFRRHESLVEMLPIPEDGDWEPTKSLVLSESRSMSGSGEISTHESDVYKHLKAKDSRMICNFTTFESNRVQWNKIMNFMEPTIKIFCPDLKALRDTFRTVITLRLVYTLTIATKAKPDKKSLQSMKPLSGEQRVVLATIRCTLQTLDWSQPSQHFHWDDSLGTNDALHWGDGDLAILQYSQAAPKAVKTKVEADIGSSRQTCPENLTCHFGFAIDMLRS